MNSIKICVIGLGYVGLPLARLFSTKYFTVGFDMNRKRVDELMAGHDQLLKSLMNYCKMLLAIMILCVLQTSIEFVDVIFMWLQCPLR